MQNQKLRDPDSRENSEWLSANIEHWLTPHNIQGKKEYLKKIQASWKEHLDDVGCLNISYSFPFLLN